MEEAEDDREGVVETTEDVEEVEPVTTRPPRGENTQASAGTQAPVETVVPASTPAPTEAQAQAPTEAPTQAPAETQTQAPVSIVSGGEEADRRQEEADRVEMPVDTRPPEQRQEFTPEELEQLRRDGLIP